jgi:hypothetical protein
MFRVGLEPTISMFERTKRVHALDRAATMFGTVFLCFEISIVWGLFGQIKLSGLAVSGPSFVLWITGKTQMSLTAAVQAVCLPLYFHPLCLCVQLINVAISLSRPCVPHGTVHIGHKRTSQSTGTNRPKASTAIPSCLPSPLLGKWARICDVLITILSIEPIEILRGNYCSYQHHSLLFWRSHGSDMKNDAA